MAKKKIVHIAQSAGGVLEYLYMFFKNFKNKDYENYKFIQSSLRKKFKEI